jgi:MFS family permease
MIDGIVGFYYHIRGVARKPGGWRIPVFNVIMGPPVFAPLLFSTVGFLGLLTSFLRRENAQPEVMPAVPRSLPWWLRRVPRTVTKQSLTLEQRVREGRFQRVLAVVTALSAFFSWVEALYSHYKNNFSYRIQWSPIVTAPLLIIASIATIWSRTVARTLMPVISALTLVNGMIGFFYHVRGAKRRPGGLKKPLYNILYGPPIFAPLLFSAAGGIGLLTSLLRRSTSK